jgi:hypothetical protein
MRFIRQKARWHQRAPGLNLWLCLVGRIRLRRHPAGLLENHLKDAGHHQQANQENNQDRPK